MNPLSDSRMDSSRELLASLNLCLVILVFSLLLVSRVCVFVGSKYRDYGYVDCIIRLRDKIES